MNSDELGSPLPKKIKKNGNSKPLGPQAQFKAKTDEHKDDTKGRERNTVGVRKNNPEVINADAKATKGQETLKAKSTKKDSTMTKTIKGEDSKAPKPETQPKAAANNETAKGAILVDLTQGMSEPVNHPTISGAKTPEDPLGSPLQLVSITVETC